MIFWGGNVRQSKPKQIPYKIDYKNLTLFSWKTNDRKNTVTEANDFRFAVSQNFFVWEFDN